MGIRGIVITQPGGNLKVNRRHKHSICALMLLAGALLPGSAGAAGILYDNLTMGSGNGAGVNASNWLGNSYSTDGNADTLISATFSLEGVLGGGDVFLELYTSTPAGPGTLLAMGTLPQAALSTSGFTDFTVAGNFLMVSNTRYWIVLGGSSSSQNDALWERAKNGTGTGVAGENMAESSNGGATWVTHGFGGDFVPFVMQIQDTVPIPEPGTLMVALLGLTGLVALRRKRR